MAVRLVVGKVVLVRVFLKTLHSFPTISALFHHFCPLTCVHLPLVLDKVSSWKHEDIYIYIYIYTHTHTHTYIYQNTLLSPMYKEFLSLIVDFHSPFHKTTKQTLSHLIYCTPTNCGLCFASFVCCVSMF